MLSCAALELAVPGIARLSVGGQWQKQTRPGRPLMLQVHLATLPPMLLGHHVGGREAVDGSRSLRLQCPAAGGRR